MSPLPLKNFLTDKINMKSLKVCSNEIVNWACKIMDKIVTNKESLEALHKATLSFEHNITLLDVIDPFELPEEYKEFIYDSWLWNKLEKTFPENMEDSNYVIQFCLDNNLSRKNTDMEGNIRQFLMYKMRILVTRLPEIHNDHTSKIFFVNPKSPGPLSTADYARIRFDAGLLVPDTVINLYD